MPDLLQTDAQMPPSDWHKIVCGINKAMSGPRDELVTELTRAGEFSWRNAVCFLFTCGFWMCCYVIPASSGLKKKVRRKIEEAKDSANIYLNGVEGVNNSDGKYFEGSGAVNTPNAELSSGLPSYKAKGVYMQVEAKEIPGTKVPCLQLSIQVVKKSVNQRYFSVKDSCRF
eukprot:Nk52_evm32s2449 gene=Nk52_evmTU32s2449